MKVLVMPSWYPNRNEKAGSFFKEQALFLKQNGFDIKILMAEELHTKSFIFHYLKRFLLNKTNTLSHDFLIQEPDAYSFPLIIQKGWSEKKQIQTANRNYLKAFKSLLKKGWIPDLVHVQGTFKAGFSAKFICDRFNIPYVVTEHSPFKLAAYSNYRQEQIKDVLLSAHKVAAVSNYQKKRLLEEGIDREISVIWNLIDENTFKPSITSHGSKFVITTITRPTFVKGVDTFFKAISAFVEKNTYEDVEVIVVGNASFGASPDSNTSYFENIATKLGIREICTFISYAAQTEIIQILQETDVFVSTSIEETFGLAVREALLCGTIVISTKSGGVEDTLNSSNSILVEVGDFNEIALHLEQIKNKQKFFDILKNRNDVISQSGRAKFLEAMTDFYTIAYD